MVLAAGIVAAGCGGAARRPFGSRRLSPSKAVAAAGRVNLSPAELGGGFRPGPALATPSARTALDRCLRLPFGRVGVTSSSFVADGGLGEQAVSSQVVVFETARRAADVVASMGSQAAPICLEPLAEAELSSLLRRERLRLQPTVAVAPLVFPVSGPADTFSYRLAVSTIAAGEQPSFSLLLDLTGFEAGDAVVELETVSASELFPVSLERRLLRGLVARARSQFG